MPKSRYKAFEIQHSNDDQKNNIRIFLAMLIQDKVHRVHEMVVRIHPNMLPADCVPERHILDSIYQLSDLQIEQTFDTVITDLESKHDVLGDKKIKSYFEEFIKPHVKTEPNIPAFGTILNKWYEREKTANATDQMKIEIYDTSRSPEDNYSAANGIWSSVMPAQTNVIVLDQEEWAEDFFKSQNARGKTFDSGLSVGPTLPFLQANDLFGVMEFGEITSIMAKTGYGKTTLASVIAEHVAWHSNSNSDCVLINLETPRLRLQHRQMSRLIDFPYWMLKSGEASPSNPKFSQFFERYRYILSKDREENNGMFSFLGVPSKRIDAIISEMKRLAKESASNGRNIVFCIDYLQVIEKEQYMGSNETAALEYIINRIETAKAEIHSFITPCHVVLFAQEGEDGKAFRVSELQRRSQLFFSFRREENETGRNVLREEFVKSNDFVNGKTMKDCLGYERYWYKANSKFTHRCQLALAKANDAGQGEHVKLFFEAPYFKIEEDLSGREQEDERILSNSAF